MYHDVECHTLCDVKLIKISKKTFFVHENNFFKIYVKSRPTTNVCWIDDVVVSTTDFSIIYN